MPASASLGERAAVSEAALDSAQLRIPLGEVERAERESGVSVASTYSR